MDNNQMYQQNQTTQQENSQYSSYYEAPVQPQIQMPEPQQELEEPVSLGEWMISMLLMCIPCVNIVLMFIWAFSSTEKKSKSNYFKAALIWMGISLVLGIIMTVLMSAGMIAAMGSMQ